MPRLIDGDALIDWLEIVPLENGMIYADTVVEYVREMPTVATDKPKRESLAMLPCKCGCVRREHWYGNDTEALVCKRCGFKVVGKNGADVIRNWNEAVKLSDQ